MEKKTQKSTLKSTRRTYLFFTALFLAVAGCDLPDPFFVPVSFIEGVPEIGTAGTPLTLNATVRPAFASNKNIVWSVINGETTGASISGNVLYTAASGTAIIKAKIANGIATGKDFTQDFTIVFTVPRVITDIAIKTQPAKLAYTEDETLDLSGIVVTLTFEDTSTEDIGLAQFAAKGVTANPAHGTVLTLAHNGQPVVITAGGHSADTGNLTVNERTDSTVHVTGVTLDHPILILIVGETTDLTATVTPSNAADQTVTWNSSDTAVATADGGTVIALSAGEATITVTTVDGGKTAECAVTVLPVPDKDARITSTGELYDTLAEAIAEAANGSLTSPTEIVVLRDITVSSGYTIPANKNIKLTVESRRHITITALPGGFSLFDVSNTSSSLTLGPTTGDGTLTLSGDNAVAASWRKGVNVGSSGSFTMNNGVTITGFNNNISFDGSGVRNRGTFTMNGGKISFNTTSPWVDAHGGGVSNGGTFTMSGGEISDNKAGEYGGGVYTNSGTFTMSDGEIKNNTAGSKGGGVYVDGGTFTMSGGTIYGADDPSKTNIAKGTASPNGAALYRSTGTAQYGGAYSIYGTNITTTNDTLPSPVTGVSLNKASTSLTVGATETLTATIAPSSATNKAVTWSSSSPTVATVSNSGLVTALSAGSTTITVTTVEGGKTATCVVTVNKPAASAVTFPTAAAITYGAALSTSSLSGGTTGRGVFEWQNSSTIPTVTNSGYPMEFTPTDTATYDYTNVSGWNGTKVVRTVLITVNKAAGSNVTAPIVEGDPATSAIKVTTPSTLITTATGQSIEYAISPSDSAAPASLSWTTGKLTFTVSADSIVLNTVYYVYARSAAGANHEAGTPSKSLAVGIYPAYASIIITFAQITDAAPNITGPTLSRTGANNTPKTIDIKVSGTGYDSYLWEITGTGITGTGDEFTLNATDSRYNQIGDHHLTLIVFKDGVPYNKTVIFKIVQ